jgi:tetratricopeptide (TPR) repeat protein
MRSITVLMLLLLASCGSTRKQLENATAYEREGMWDEAYERYAAVFERKPKEVQAHIGMKRSAQALFDRMQQRAVLAYRSNELETGDQARSEAISFRNRMQRDGIVLEENLLIEADRNAAVKAKAAKLYAEAEAAFRAERFDDAESLAIACTRLDRENRDAEHLMKLAQVEPLYREALLGMELKLWREAYRKFEQVIKLDAGHKDSMQRMAECRQHAAYTLTYVPLFNRGLQAVTIDVNASSSSLDAQLAANIKRHILDLHDDLVMLVDRDNTDELLAEQQRQMSGVYDERYVAEAGKLLGARYVLTGKILRYDDVLGRNMEVQIQLLDAESGRIHLSEIVRVNKQELARGPARPQLLERIAKRAARALAEFEPVTR